MDRAGGGSLGEQSPGGRSKSAEGGRGFFFTGDKGNLPGGGTSGGCDHLGEDHDPGNLAGSGNSNDDGNEYNQEGNSMKGNELDLKAIYEEYIDEVLRGRGINPDIDNTLAEVQAAGRDLERAQERRENALQEIAWKEGFLFGLNYRQ